MKTILQQWNLMRILRLGLGIAIIVQGVSAKEIITVVLGVIFGGMTLLNIGCCGMNGCTINSRTSEKPQKIDYDKLDSKK